MVSTRTERSLSLWLLLCALSGGALIWGAANEAAVFHTPVGRAVQAFTWEEASRLRVFLALQTLLAAVLATTLGFLSLVSGRRIGRILWPSALLLLLIYYRVDPRFRPNELHLLLRGVLVLFAGFLFGIWGLPIRRGSNSYCRRAAEILFALSTFVLVVAVARLATGDFILEWSAMEPRGSYALSFLFFGGIGAGRAQFELETSDKKQPTSGLEKLSGKWIFATTLLSALGAITVGAGIFLLFGSAKLLPWALVVPVTPCVLSVYGPMSWFAIDGSLFAEEANTPAFSSSSRLILGVIFQYFTAAVLWAGISSAGRPGTLRRKVFYHLILVAYWIPGLWLAWTMARAL